MNVLLRFKEEGQRKTQQQEVHVQPAEVRGNSLNDAHRIKQEQVQRNEQQKTDPQIHLDAEVRGQMNEADVWFYFFFL